MNERGPSERKTGRIIPWPFHRDVAEIRNFRQALAERVQGCGRAGTAAARFPAHGLRNLERAGVSRSVAMAMVGHKTQAIYSRYAIADEASLREAAVKLAILHDGERLSKDVR